MVCTQGCNSLSGKSASDKRLGTGEAVIKRRAVFGLPEPAGSRNAEDIQVVFDAAANEKAVTVEGRRGSQSGTAARAQGR